MLKPFGLNIFGKRAANYSHFTTFKMSLAIKPQILFVDQFESNRKRFSTCSSPIRPIKYIDICSYDDK